MMPTTQNTPSFAQADNTRQMLGMITDDIRSQLRRWQSISALLRCPLVAASRSRRKTAALADEAVGLLRGMLACAKEAIRAFGKRRYDRCLLALDKLERLRRALEAVEDKVALGLLGSLSERGRSGRRN